MVKCLACSFEGSKEEFKLLKNPGSPGFISPMEFHFLEMRQPRLQAEAIFEGE